MVSYCQNEGANLFLAVEIDLDAMDSYETDMLYNNFIDGIIQPEFRAIDGKMMMYCKINGMIRLCDYVENIEIGRTQIAELISSICGVVTEADEYMLNANSLVLDIDKIFCCKGSSYKFIYATGTDCAVGPQLRRLVEDLMRMIKAGNTEALNYLYGLYDIVVEDNYDIADVYRYVKNDDSRGRVSAGEKNSHGRTDDFTSDIDVCTGDGLGSVAARADDNKHGDSFGNYYRSETDKALMDVVFGDAEKEKKRGSVCADKTPQNLDESRENTVIKILTAVAVAVGVGIVAFEYIRYGGIVNARPVMVDIIAVALLMFIGIEIKKKRPDTAAPDSTKSGSQADDMWRDISGVYRRGEHCREEHCTSDAMRCKLTDESADTGTGILSDEAGETVLLGAFDGGNMAGNRKNLVIELSGNEEKSIVQMENGEKILGRDKNAADMVVSDRSVSRRHAALCEQDGSVFIEDLSSTNGTFVNDIRIPENKRWKLRKGDILRIGDKKYSIDIYECTS